MEDQAEELVIVDLDEVEFVRRIASEHNVSVDEVTARGIEPVLTITLILVGTAAAVGAAVSLIDEHRGGQVIDLRRGVSKTFYRSRDIKYGLILILTVDGHVQVEVKEPRGAFGQLVDGLTSLVGDLGSQSASSVAQAVQKTLGDEVAVVQRQATATKAPTPEDHAPSV